MGFIYLVENDINDNKYVGLTTRTVEARWREHLRHSDEVLDKAIQKYGKEHFTVRTIEECPDEELDAREQYWIAYYDSYNHGYNCTEGGRRPGMNIDVPSKYKIVKELWDQGMYQRQIQQQTGFNITTVHNYLLKYGVTEEEIRARGNEVIGKSKCRPVIQFTKTGEFVKEWPSATEAANTLGINRKNITANCGGHRKSCEGYIWRYKDKCME